MNKTDRNSIHHRDKLLVAMFAAAASLAGGTQAIAPSTAGAIVADCTSTNGIGDWLACHDNPQGGGDVRDIGTDPFTSHGNLGGDVGSGCFSPAQCRELWGDQNYGEPSDDVAALIRIQRCNELRDEAIQLSAWQEDGHVLSSSRIAELLTFDQKLWESNLCVMMLGSTLAGPPHGGSLDPDTTDGDFGNGVGYGTSIEGDAVTTLTTPGNQRRKVKKHRRHGH